MKERRYTLKSKEKSHMTGDKTMQKINYTLYADNAGGITLETSDDYVHHYDHMSQLANDVQKLQAGKDTAGWDGNEAGKVHDKQYSDILDQDDILSLIKQYNAIADDDELYLCDEDGHGLGAAAAELIELLAERNETIKDVPSDANIVVDETTIKVLSF